MIAAGHKSGMIRLWETATGTPSVDLEAHTEQIGSLAFSRDDRLLLSGASDRTVRVWDIATGGQSTLLEVPDERVVSVAFSPDGLPMAFGGSWRRVEVWDVATGGSIGTLSGEYTGSASAAALSPDGGTYVFGEFSVNNFRVEVWDLAEEENIATLNGHSAPITAVAYARDRPIFASGSTDGSVLVWDMRLILPHPKSLAKLAGDEQEGTPGLTLAEPFVIEVRDQKGRMAEGRRGLLRGHLRRGDPLRGTRDDQPLRGQASTTLTLGNAPGPNTVEVEVEGVEPVTFTAHTRSIPTTLGKIGGDGQQGPGGASLPEPLVVSLLDQAGSPLAGVAVSFEVTGRRGHPLGDHRHHRPRGPRRQHPDPGPYAGLQQRARDRGGARPGDLHRPRCRRSPESDQALRRRAAGNGGRATGRAPGGLGAGPERIGPTPAPWSPLLSPATAGTSRSSPTRPAPRAGRPPS